MQNECNQCSNSDAENTMVRMLAWLPIFALFGSAVCAEINLDLGLGDKCITAIGCDSSILKCEPIEGTLGVVGECKLGSWFIGVIVGLIVAILAGIIIPCICCPCCFLYNVITCKCCRS